MPPVHPPEVAESRRLRQVAAVFAPLGWRAIGGPAVHVALMDREVVGRRRWLEREEFRRLFAACNLLPGPSSTQLALLLGLRRAGVAGMLLTGLLFIGPAVLVMLLLGELYAHVGSGRVIDQVLLGVEAVVVAIVARAALDLSQLVARDWLGLALTLGACLATLVFQVSPILVLAAAALVGFASRELTVALGGAGGGAAPMVISVAGVSVPSAAASLLIPLGLTFLKIGLLAFGSGYVLLPFLHADLVGGRFGLTDHQLADAFAAGQVTPGPVFAVAAFLGVQVAGIAGGVVAALAIFLPSLLLAPLVDVVMRAVMARPALRAALDAVVAAAVGLIGAAAVALARAALVGPIEVVAAVFAVVLLWRRPTAQPVALALGLVAGGLLALTSL